MKEKKNLILQNENDLEQIQNKANDKQNVTISQLKNTIQKQNQETLQLQI